MSMTLLAYEYILVYILLYFLKFINNYKYVLYSVIYSLTANNYVAVFHRTRQLLAYCDVPSLAQSLCLEQLDSRTNTRQMINQTYNESPLIDYHLTHYYSMMYTLLHSSPYPHQDVGQGRIASHH